MSEQLEIRIGEDNVLEYHEDMQYMYIEYIQTREQGKGKVMLDHLLTLTNKPIVAEVNYKNMIARRFFEKNGFEDEGLSEYLITYVLPRRK